MSTDSSFHSKCCCVSPGATKGVFVSSPLASCRSCQEQRWQHKKEHKTKYIKYLYFNNYLIIIGTSIPTSQAWFCCIRHVPSCSWLGFTIRISGAMTGDPLWNTSTKMPSGGQALGLHGKSKDCRHSLSSGGNGFFSASLAKFSAISTFPSESLTFASTCAQMTAIETTLTFQFPNGDDAQSWDYDCCDVICMGETFFWPDMTRQNKLWDNMILADP